MENGCLLAINCTYSISILYHLLKHPHTMHIFVSENVYNIILTLFSITSIHIFIFFWLIVLGCKLSCSARKRFPNLPFNPKVKFAYLENRLKLPVLKFVQSLRSLQTVDRDSSCPKGCENTSEVLS